MTIIPLPPVKRNYTLNVSEDELKIIGVLLGKTKPQEFTTKLNSFMSYSGTPNDQGLISKMFGSVTSIFNHD